MDEHYPRSFVAELAAVNPHVVSMWATRGWLRENEDGTTTRLRLRYKLDRKGQRLYRLGDVFAARKDTDANPRCHRERAAA